MHQAAINCGFGGVGPLAEMMTALICALVVGVLAIVVGVDWYFLRKLKRISPKWASTKGIMFIMTMGDLRSLDEQRQEGFAERVSAHGEFVTDEYVEEFIRLRSRAYLWMIALVLSYFIILTSIGGYLGLVR